MKLEVFRNFLLTKTIENTKNIQTNQGPQKHSSANLTQKICENPIRVSLEECS